MRSSSHKDAIVLEQFLSLTKLFSTNDVFGYLSISMGRSVKGQIQNFHVSVCLTKFY